MLQRREWVLRGVLDYNLNLSILVIIIAKYEHIDAVPLGYYQAELSFKTRRKLSDIFQAGRIDTEDIFSVKHMILVEISP